MSAYERKQTRILTLLRQYHRLSVSDVVSALNVSEATVRRHFKEMEKNGQLIRVSGGICLPSGSADMEYLFSHHAATRIAEKQSIGHAAVQLLENHDRLFFDSGTTVRECGNALVERCTSEKLEDVSILTNSLAYNEKLPQLCNMGLIGGSIRPLRMDLAGMAALNNIRRYNFTKALLGADGISADGTLFTTDEESSLLANAALEQSKAVIIVADFSKIGINSFVQYGTMNGAKFTLVTNDCADPEILQNLKQNGVRVITTSSKRKADR